LERCELPRRSKLNRHKGGRTLFSDEPHHKGLVHLPLSESFEAESGAFTTTTRGTTHNWIGGSRMATSDHKRSQPPQWHLGSKDSRVTNSQTFNFHEFSWRAQTDAQCNGKSTSAQILHSQIPPKATNAYGGEERKNKEENHTRTPRSRSTRFPSLRGEMDWWKCRSRSSLTFPSKICKNHGRNWERGKLSKVNNGGERGGNFVLGRACLFGELGGLL
jgi:hypothetical protein